MYIYVWMVCSGSKKHIPIPIKEENNPGSSNQKCFKVVWHLEPMGAGGVNTDNLAEFPSFVLNAVKVNLLETVRLYIFIVFILIKNKRTFSSIYIFDSWMQFST